METKLAYSQLQISPKNVRTVSPDKEQDKRLLASIEAHGVLQNLVVIPVEGNDEAYEVIAGGRRFAALGALVAAGKIANDSAIPCLIAHADDAEELSLAENMKADMHPADVFVAFKKMADLGRSVRDISVRFGRTQKEVKQLLRLADVSPVIVEAFRRDEIDLNIVMAFTVSDDIERQESVFNDLKGRYINSHSVKSRLVNSDLDTDSDLVKFVTLKEYVKAGGAVCTDLFADTKYIVDIDLLERLANEKMVLIVEEIKAEGWKWVETTFDCWLNLNARHSRGELVNVPDELNEKLKAANAELESINDVDVSDYTDELMEKYWADMEVLEDKVSDLEDEIENYRVFTPAFKQNGGVKICLRDGKAEITYGYTKPEDMPKIESDNTEPSSDAPKANDSVSESNALRVDLANYELQAMRSVIMTDPNACFDLATFTMAQSTFAFGYQQKSVHVSLTLQDMNATKDIADTKAAEAIANAKEQLNLGFLEYDTDLEKFTHFQLLSRQEKKAIHAFCIAASLTSSNNALVQSVAEKLNFDLSDHWQPTKENYFNRLKKDDILRIAKELKDDDFAKQHSDAKKGDLATLVADMDEVKGWIPSSLSA